MFQLRIEVSAIGKNPGHLFDKQFRSGTQQCSKLRVAERRDIQCTNHSFSSKKKYSHFCCLTQTESYPLQLSHVFDVSATASIVVIDTVNVYCSNSFINRF